jgi:hypothetical protein
MNKSKTTPATPAVNNLVKNLIINSLIQYIKFARVVITIKIMVQNYAKNIPLV